MKEKIKYIIVFILGILISVVINVTAATIITSSEISYTDNKSIGASNVQTALDNTYTNISNLNTNVSTLQSDFNTGVVKAVSFSGTIGKAYASKTTITATAQSGYTFVSWYHCHTSGWVAYVYASSPLNATSDFWNASGVGTGWTGTGDVICEALYRKNL